jgi:hypothetical protein
MTPSDAPLLLKQLNALADVYEKKHITTAALQIWMDVLRDLPTEHIMDSLNNWARYKGRFPAPSEVWNSVNERGIKQREAKNAHEREINKQPYCFEERSARTDAFVQKIKDLYQQPSNATNPKVWSKRILDRHRAGEHIAPYALQCALEVSGDGPAPRVAEEREPGADG